MNPVAEFPHCNIEVLHAPGTCHYCDLYPNKQALRAATNTPFTPAEANGWSGNVAVRAGEMHSHMGASYLVGDEVDQTRPKSSLISRLRSRMTR